MVYTQDPSTDTPFLVSRKKAAFMLGICEGTVDNMVKRGELEAVWVARRRMIPMAEVERIVAGREPQGPKYLSHGDAWREDHADD